MSDPDHGIPEEYIISRNEGMYLTVKSEWWEIPTEEGQRAQHPKPMHPNDVRDPCVLAHKHAMKVFKDSYPHPFLVAESDNFRTPREWGDAPRSIVELQMCALSAAIRDKPDWQKKMKNLEILAKWREEALEQHPDEEDLEAWKLTVEMIDYVLQELEGYARIRDAENGIEIACYERVWKSDALVPPGLLDRLLAGVKKLEDVPPKEKDWHPGSNNQVLDLVHPSLYPIAYAKSLQEFEDGDFDFLVPPEGHADFVSEAFAWLPSDFIIDADGTANLSEGAYINNLHPDDHADLYPVIEELVALAVPMFERVLSDLKRPLSKARMVTEPRWNYDMTNNEQVHTIPCIWEKDGKSIGVPSPDRFGIDWNGWTDEDFEEFENSLTKRLPRPLPAYVGALDGVKKIVSLAGATLQIIVKLANIVLTPENPSYAGGSWHVEGMLNEEIVATFIYYYDEDNISESRLAFRTSVVEPLYHGQDDEKCTQIIYGLARDRPLVQELGSVRTCQGRCIAFPNVYQHQVQPFELADATKPGHRKILAFFLVNPDIQIPSTTSVPPRQYEWAVNECRDALLERVPPEIVHIICEYILTFTCTREETKKERKALMKERSRFVATHTKRKYQVGFNLCEH
ncbi:hypothetical protein BDZ89DRAFT_995158 [Hymenopellis radicata]|nr:hypothetical protein BDZ89DRAFT_995158 [Hymenopellis radicata]